MSELATLARPYAVATFKRAKETNSIKKWSQDLAFMSAVLSDETISVVVDNPKVSKQQISTFVLAICQEQIDQEAENLLQLLVQNNRLTLLPVIAKLFEAYKTEDAGLVDVDVFVAYAFSKEDKPKFIATLEKTLGKKVNMKVTVDKSLIGGVLVRAGDRVIDGSIKGQLQQMQKTLQ
jgi:F-type H+-transporting ATPase subunit delta